MTTLCAANSLCQMIPYIPAVDCQSAMQNAVDMTIRAHEQAVCIPENPKAAQLPVHTRPAGRARISLLSQVPTDAMLQSVLDWRRRTETRQPCKGSITMSVLCTLAVGTGASHFL